MSPEREEGGRRRVGGGRRGERGRRAGADGGGAGVGAGARRHLGDASVEELVIFIALLGGGLLDGVDDGGAARLLDLELGVGDEGGEDPLEDGEDLLPHLRRRRGGERGRGVRGEERRGGAREEFGGGAARGRTLTGIAMSMLLCMSREKAMTWPSSSTSFDGRFVTSASWPSVVICSALFVPLRPRPSRILSRCLSMSASL